LELDTGEGNIDPIESKLIQDFVKMSSAICTQCQMLLLSNEAV